ncbi:Cationic amino acid transporter 5 [Spatholobus suberectus]|nr:Cationic amino acid transporter 5 [Spatholobus suberectus]
MVVAMTVVMEVAVVTMVVVTTVMTMMGGGSGSGDDGGRKDSNSMSLFLTQQRVPRVWGVPLVTWLPSLSIVTNVFLMGSLEYEAFIRFGVCTVVMLIYYFIFGLHATYEMAHQQVKLQSKVDHTETIKNAGP